MLSISDVIHFYNNLGYIFRYEVDKNDRSVKNIIDRMIVDNVSEGERIYIRRNMLKSGVDKQRAPYKIILEDTEIHIYTAQNNTIKEGNFPIQMSVRKKAFKNDLDKVIFFLCEDYLIMDPVGLNYGKEDRFEKIFSTVLNFYRQIFLNLFGYSKYSAQLADVFSSLFLIQTLNTLEKNKFVDIFNKTYMGRGNEIWNLCNDILDVTEATRGIPYLYTMKEAQIIQEMVTEYVTWND